jgi:hypothetical protein
MTTCRAPSVSLSSAQTQLAIDLQGHCKTFSRNSAKTLAPSAGANHPSEVFAISLLNGDVPTPTLRSAARIHFAVPAIRSLGVPVLTQTRRWVAVFAARLQTAASKMFPAEESAPRCLQR